MNAIFETYNSLVNKFRVIEKDTGPDEIHDKRVILRRIFPVLTAFGISPSKVKNGDKAFKLYGKLRDIQVQIDKLENLELNPPFIEYLEFLKVKESKLKEKVHKFSIRNEVKYPLIKKKMKVNVDKIKIKAIKQQIILIAKIQSLINGDAIKFHLIRIDFKKYRYIVEVLRYIDIIDEEKLEEMKYYQDMLGEIHDYEVFNNAVRRYCKKRSQFEVIDIDIFIKNQIVLEENFINSAKKLIEICKSVIYNNSYIIGLNSNFNSKTDQRF
ncbi:MAG: CHAD domain-containing protein [Bacteroidales bacterium]